MPNRLDPPQRPTTHTELGWEHDLAADGLQAARDPLRARRLDLDRVDAGTPEARAKSALVEQAMFEEEQAVQRLDDICEQIRRAVDGP